ncbi:MAG: hypothetical protein ACXWLY_17820 [Thermoanaerobaculia bacterium]
MFEDWIERRIAVAERLAKGDCGGSYAEAFLILSALISGIAADLWPGERIDRVRFVELWARYSDPSLGANLVSVPLLIHALDEESSPDFADRLRAENSHYYMPRGFPDSIVVTGETVDLFDDDVRRILPELPLGKIREWSYGNVFYVHFRSGYVHEYQAGTHADEIVMSTTRSNVTYGNFFERPHRRINFEVGWIAAVARSIVERAAAEWGRRPVGRPNEWWLRGAS